MKRRKNSYIWAGLFSGLLLLTTGCGGQTEQAVPVSTEDGVSVLPEEQTRVQSAEEAVQTTAQAENEATQTENADLSATSDEDLSALSAHADTVPADGVYLASFDTDNSMFHINEAYEGRGVLTVEGGEMTLHIVLPSKNIVNLYYGLAEDAQKDGAELLEPVVENVTYSDGITEEVYAFDVPVPWLEEEFNLALVGTKGTWYDHKVTVSDPVPVTADEEDGLPIGSYTVEVRLEGGSGRASVTSPCILEVTETGMTVTIEWSSPYYDYMIVDGIQYEPVNTEGNSCFIIPLHKPDEALEVVADTTAMSTPHEISYTLYFDGASAVLAE